MKEITIISTLAVIMGGIIALSQQTETVAGTLFFIPFTLGPLFVTLALACFCQRSAAQGLLQISTVAYAIWFTWFYREIFHLHLDPQSGVALLFVGIYSVPVMVLLWIPALMMRKRKF